MWSEAIDMSKHGICRETGILSVPKDGKYIFSSGNGYPYWALQKSSKS
jgi:hypothetical protein